ncbi:hypothetical protein TNCV_747201 [Trichonephila clavipes]|nr:hypothetical protein TNCV_747201 [Trichonephila clavipes]
MDRNINCDDNNGFTVSFSGSDSALIRGLRSAFLSLLGTQTVPGSLQFGFRNTSRSPYRFLYRGRVLTRAPSKIQSPSRWRGITTAPSNPNLPSGALAPLIPLSLTISRLIILLSSLVLLPPLSNSAPLISFSSAAPIGLGSLDLVSVSARLISCPSTAPTGLNSIPL